ncbi:MAG TPA: RNA-binding cell elongation regulator Jag/EloR [Anaerolineae bacterium]|nr:RNA-binding cell elongation regulator Jag/EloR [Anaerolineae bacterium]
MEAAQPERRSVVASGKTVEDAIKNGLVMLGLRREQVDIEVISEGSRGVLGIGAEHARVRLIVSPPPAPTHPAVVPAAPPAITPEPATQTLPPAALPAGEKPAQETRRPARRRSRAKPQAKPAFEAFAQEAAGELSDSAEVARQVLDELMQKMGIPAEVEVQSVPELSDEGEPATMVLNLIGEDLGMLIGRRGETLGAMQYLLRLMVSHRTKHWSNLVVDVEGYRVRRLNALGSLAKRMADEVARTGRSQAMEPMPPDERRLVHMALRNHPRVTTQSVGEGERRKVTVIPRK